MKILRISSKDTYDIRHKLLRPGSPREEAIFEHDEEEQTFHLGGFIEGKLSSVASFYFEKHPKLDEQYQYRLRGMATLPENQEQGLSSELLNMAFSIIQQNLCSLLWCNARIKAVGFYEKVGFEKVGEFFDIPTVGEHVLMVKKSNQFSSD